MRPLLKTQSQPKIKAYLKTVTEIFTLEKVQVKSLLSTSFLYRKLTEHGRLFYTALTCYEDG